MFAYIIADLLRQGYCWHKMDPRIQVAFDAFIEGIYEISFHQSSHDDWHHQDWIEVKYGDVKFTILQQIEVCGKGRLEYVSSMITKQIISLKDEDGDYAIVVQELLIGLSHWDTIKPQF